MLEILGALGGIILVDLVLSGDNALVIGAAASNLPRRQRWYAIVLGGGGAIVLRILSRRRSRSCWCCRTFRRSAAWPCSSSPCASSWSI